MTDTVPNKNISLGDFMYQDGPDGLLTNWIGTLAEPCTMKFSYASSVSLADGLSSLPGKPIAKSSNNRSVTYLLKTENDVYYTIESEKNENINIHLLTELPNEAKLQETKDLILKVLPVDDPTPKQKVRFGFWANSEHGPRRRSRAIYAHQWDEIKNNYPGETGEGLDGLMRGFRPSNGGQLLLLSGPPGVGKTNAIRGLAWEWRKWCSFEYVTDPEAFFGKANYLLSVLIENEEEADDDDDEATRDINEFFDDLDGVLPKTEEEPKTPKHPWRIFILEDTGELLQPDAKEAVGQGLSRLLNTLDGLIGQGLRVLVLITTNEELGKIHPAVSRPGRCAANVKFDNFSSTEAQEWLKNKYGKEITIKGHKTLADLYAIGTDTKPAVEELKVGFRAGV